VAGVDDGGTRVASGGFLRFLASDGLSTSMKIHFTDPLTGTLRTVDRPLKTLFWEALSVPFLVPAIWRALRNA
jgi:hypothetical protein